MPQILTRALLPERAVSQALLFTLMIWVVIHMILQSQIEALSEKLVHLMKDTPSIVVNKDKNSAVPEFFEQLFKPTISKSCLERISYDHHQFRMVGRARSLADVTSFLREWRLSKSFKSIQLSRLQPMGHYVAFEVSIR